MSPLITNLLLLTGGCGVLYFGAEWLVRGAARLGVSVGLSPVVIGLTIVSLGTSAPELVVSLIAALEGKPDIAIGNVMGSNLANIGLILGITAVIRPLSVTSRVVTREVPLMLLITVLLYPLIWDHNLSRLDGVVLLLTLALYLGLVFRSGLEEEPEILGDFQDFVVHEHVAKKPARRLPLKDIWLIVVGCTALVLGGRAIVSAAEYVATTMGISQLTIGVTVIAVGTSLPELATSVVAAIRREADIAVGNIIGSNIFNIAAILGVTSTITAITVHPSVLLRELPAVLFLSIIVWPVTRSAFMVQRWEGFLLLTLYFGIGYWLV